MRLGTFQNSLLLASEDWKVPVKAAQSLQQSCSELVSIPSLMMVFTSFRAGEVKLPQRRSPYSGTDFTKGWRTGGLGVPSFIAGERVLHLVQGGGFITLESLLLQSGIPTSAWQSHTRKPSATEATGTLSWRTIWKKEFLICGKFQHSEICFSSTYKREAKIPRSVWNGSPGEEEGEGMEKIKKHYFEGKKLKSCWYCFSELCHFLTSRGTKPDPREDSQSLQLRENLGEMHGKQANN